MHVAVVTCNRFDTEASAPVLHSMIYVIEPWSVQRGLKASEQSIGPCQPAQSKQADMGRNFFAIFKFSASQRTALHHDTVGCLTEWTFMDP